MGMSSTLIVRPLPELPPTVKRASVGVMARLVLLVEDGDALVADHDLAFAEHRAITLEYALYGHLVALGGGDEGIATLP